MSSHPISPPEAWRRLCAATAPLPAERLPRRNARGRVLAEDLRATVDVPPADVSAMDGYGIAGTVAAGAAVPVAGTVAAGDPPGFALPPGQAVQIMTGAPVPPEVERVVPVERTERRGDTVCFVQASEKRRHIRRRGEVLEVGDPVMPAGTVLRAAALALAATHGYGELSVIRTPTVSILATGDEVVAPEREPRPGQLRDSHTDFLLAALADRGYRTETLGIAPDDPDILERHIRRGLEADVLLVCGGVSAGEYDYAEGVLEKLGCESLFDAVAIQPGKPLVAATHPGGLVFGLPGNPASVMVSFTLFVLPLLRRLAGHEADLLDEAQIGTLTFHLPAQGARTKFLPVRVAPGDHPNPPQLHLLESKGSHDLAAYGKANALLHRPADAPEAVPGDQAQFLSMP
ncbi:MAG: gephyrin-like molybdotransferase Glp [Acidobacteriota bacterium]